MAKVAKVVLRHKSKYVDREYSYLATPETKLGAQVLVPFGKGNRPYEAVVTEMIEQEDAEDLKKIVRVVSDFTISPKKLELAKWIRDRYMSSFSEAINLFFSKAQEIQKLHETYLVTELSSEELEQKIASENKNSRNKLMLLQLLLEGEVNLSALQRELGKSLLQSARALEKENALIIEERRVHRVPMQTYQLEQKNITLNHNQQLVAKQIGKNIAAAKQTLLYGITGSGKTEVYIELIKKCLENKKQAIVLVPEISLTPQTIARFKNIFGDRIGIFHSKISDGERKDQNDLILSGKIDLVIGARSALFAPFENLGLIIIDECHDDAYKSEQSPKYDAIEVAEQLCKMYGAGLVIGSATPTIEQYYQAVYGDYDLQTLSQREGGILPTMEIVDTFEEMKMGNLQLLSKKAIQAIQKEVDEEKQVIIFLNKRGFATTLTCDFCNHTAMCPSCDISLTYHQVGNKLLCHYCGHQEEYHKKCKNCAVGHYQHIGYGTQRIEQEISSLVQNANIVRLDKDTTQGKDSHEKLLQRFKNQESNILIGTQMISKGLDFEKVSLVVVLNADQGLRFPDYRSKEKTLSQILQVSGRAGRGSLGGKVIVQTNDSGNKIFEYAIKQDYSGFFWEEIKERKAFLYPPFSTLLRIQCAAEQSELAAETAVRIKDAVEYYLTKRERNITAIGPAPNLIQRIENKYRWQMFYKIENDEDVVLTKKIIQYILTEKRAVVVPQGVFVSVDINPKNMI